MGGRGGGPVGNVERELAESRDGASLKGNRVSEPIYHFQMRIRDYLTGGVSVSDFGQFRVCFW